MKRHFCDLCDTELTRDNTFELTKEGALNASTSIVPLYVYPVDGIDICKHCVIDAIKSHDSRPTQNSQEQSK